jgi:thiol-disulfide isomerase/thioredoxin
MNKLFLILLSITFFNYIKSFFENAKFIKSSIDAEVMMKEIKKSKKLTLILFYSPSCPHCKRFEPEYIKLSEYFKNKVSFYALNAKIANYKKLFTVEYIPKLFIYHKEEIKLYKGRNKFDVLVKYIQVKYLKECLFIEKNEIPKFQNDFKNDNTEFNYVIGLFTDKEKMNIFINETNNNINLVNYCYYSLIESNLKRNSNIVLLYNKNRGMNQFTDFQFNISEDIISKYHKFLDEKSEKMYYYINSTKDLQILSNNDKDSIIFSFNNQSQIEKIKKRINIFDMNYGNKFKYVIMNYNNNNTGEEIYYYDRFTSKISNINFPDLLNQTNDIKNNNIESVLLDTSKIVFYEDENLSLDFAVKIVFFLIYLIIYSVIFCIFLILTEKDDEE